MKALVIETTNFTPHLETALEISVNHVIKGDVVFFRFIGHAVFQNRLLVRRSRYIPDSCLPENIGAKLIGKKNFFFKNIFKIPFFSEISIPEFKNISELKEFQYKNFNVGMAVYSSLTFAVRDAYPDLANYNFEINQMIKSAIRVYEYSVCEILDLKPDIVYLFNGRFFENSAILAAARALGCPVKIHERGASKSRYTLRSLRPHSVQGQLKELNAMMNNVKSYSQVSADGRKYFVERRAGIEQHWHTFRDGQDSSVNVSLFPSDCERRFVYFQSSDDEIMSVSDIVDLGPFESQINAVKILLNLLDKNPLWFLVIRLHPNMRDKVDSLKLWNSLNLPENVVIVQPESKYDSYKIMESADCSISFNSTMGIESVFWGVPSIVLGPSLFAGSDAVHTPNNLKHLEKLMSEKCLSVVPVKSYKFGYFLKNYGKEFSYYHAISLSQGVFLNKNLQQCGVCLLFRKIFQAVNLVRSFLINKRNFGK